MTWGGHQTPSVARTASSSETFRLASTKTGSTSVPHLSVDLRFIYSSSSTAILLLFSAGSLYPIVYSLYNSSTQSYSWLLTVVSQTFSSLDSACLSAAESVNAALLGYIQELLQFSHILFWQCVYVCKYEEHSSCSTWLGRFKGENFYSPLLS